MVSSANVVRWGLVPAVLAVLVLSGCSRGPMTAEAALNDYVAAVNARDRGALEALAGPVESGNYPAEFADWVLARAPAEPMEMDSFKIVSDGIPTVSYGHVKWAEKRGVPTRGVPTDGEFIFTKDQGLDGPWTVGFLNEGPGEG